MAARTSNGRTRPRTPLRRPRSAPLATAGGSPRARLAGGPRRLSPPTRVVQVDSVKIPRSKYMATAERTEGTEGTETIHNEGTEIRRRTEKTELVGRRESDLPRQAAGDDEKPTDQNGTRCTSRFDLWVSRHRTAGLRPAAGRFNSPKSESRCVRRGASSPFVFVNPVPPL